jgi:hypothetical protein
MHACMPEFDHAYVCVPVPSMYMECDIVCYVCMHMYNIVDH